MSFVLHRVHENRHAGRSWTIAVLRGCFRARYTWNTQRCCWRVFASPRPTMHASMDRSEKLDGDLDARATLSIDPIVPDSAPLTRSFIIVRACLQLFLTFARRMRPLLFSLLQGSFEPFRLIQQRPTRTTRCRGYCNANRRLT